MNKISELDALARKISSDEHDELLSGDLSEVCELHARGYLVEVIAVSVVTDLFDGDTFEGFTVACGKIDGKTYRSDDLHNVTCIGDGFTYHADARFYAFSASEYSVQDVFAFASGELAKTDLVDSV